jgi:hypothetical protein
VSNLKDKDRIVQSSDWGREIHCPSWLGGEKIVVISLVPSDELAMPFSNPWVYEKFAYLNVYDLDGRRGEESPVTVRLEPALFKRFVEDANVRLPRRFPFPSASDIWRRQLLLLPISGLSLESLEVAEWLDLELHFSDGVETSLNECVMVRKSLSVSLSRWARDCEIYDVIYGCVWVTWKKCCRRTFLTGFYVMHQKMMIVKTS